MQVARTPEGKLIDASATAPNQALCPTCGGVVMLRARRVGPRSHVVYFWRHLDNRNLKCAERSHRAAQSRD